MLTGLESIKSFSIEYYEDEGEILNETEEKNVIINNEEYEQVSFCGIFVEKHIHNKNTFIESGKFAIIKTFNYLDNLNTKIQKKSMYEFENENENENNNENYKNLLFDPEKDNWNIYICDDKNYLSLKYFNDKYSICNELNKFLKKYNSLYEIFCFLQNECYDLNKKICMDNIFK